MQITRVIKMEDFRRTSCAFCNATHASATGRLNGTAAAAAAALHLNNELCWERDPHRAISSEGAFILICHSSIFSCVCVCIILLYHILCIVCSTTLPVVANKLHHITHLISSHLTSFSLNRVAVSALWSDKVSRGCEWPVTTSRSRCLISHRSQPRLTGSLHSALTASQFRCNEVS